MLTNNREDYANLESLIGGKSYRDHEEDENAQSLHHKRQDRNGQEPSQEPFEEATKDPFFQTEQARLKDAKNVMEYIQMQEEIAKSKVGASTAPTGAFKKL